MSDYSYTVAETENRRVRLVIMDDSYSMNPREDDEHACGALTIPDRRYFDVAHPGDLAETARDRLFAGEYARYSGHMRDRYSLSAGVHIFERWVRVFHGGVTLLDTLHDGPTVVWYMTPAMMRDRGFTGDAATDTERMAEIVRGERDTYRAWAEGDVWGYVLEERAEWHLVQYPGTDREVHTSGVDWTEVESVWGFIGSQYAEEEARAALEYAAGTDA